MDADFWQAVVVTLITQAGVVLAAGIPVWRRLGRVDNQVSNSHTTNMRDDLDRAIRTSTENRKWIASLALEVRRMSDTLERRRRWLR